jgi:hypothetical protein
MDEYDDLILMALVFSFVAGFVAGGWLLTCVLR